MGTEVTVFNPADDFAQMRQSDVIVPALRLQQPTTPAVVDGIFKAGQYVVDNADVVIDKDKTSRFVPLMFWLQWMEFNIERDVPKDKKVLNRSLDPNSELAKEAEAMVKVIDAKGNKVNKVTEFYNFVVMLPDVSGYSIEGMYVIGFSKSSHFIAKQFLNRLRRIRVNNESVNIWRHAFELGAQMKQDKGNKWFVPMIGAASPVPQEQWSFLNETATRLRENRKKIAERQMEEEANASHGEPASAEM